MHNPWARFGPRMCYIRPSWQLKSTRNFSWMTSITLESPFMCGYKMGTLIVNCYWKGQVVRKIACNPTLSAKAKSIRLLRLYRWWLLAYCMTVVFMQLWALKHIKSRHFLWYIHFIANKSIGRHTATRLHWCRFWKLYIVKPKKRTSDWSSLFVFWIFWALRFI